jgi:Bacteriocin-protection, YdeI or OmpD-Associated/Domain of unknown function (DUF1905)
MNSFSAKILKIGINPYVAVPAAVLRVLFRQAQKDKGPIPVRGSLNGYEFMQTLVKYSGKWRLYLNTPMRKAAGIDVGDTANVQIEFDSHPRTIEMHPALKQALSKNKTAASVFSKLTPSYQKEIIRYINSLKTKESVDKNIKKAIEHLLGKERFVGRDGA